MRNYCATTTVTVRACYVVRMGTAHRATVESVTDPDHRTSIVQQAQWDVWRPVCECGWVGSYNPTIMTAECEALEHRRLARSGD